MRYLLFCAALATAPLWAADRPFDFSQSPPDQMPPGFRSTVAGAGKPGDWKVVMDDVPSLLTPMTPRATSVAKRAVLAQLARDTSDEHFPICIFDKQTYRDFTFTTRFKTMGGVAEQMAGIVFRYQDEKNYYVLLANSLHSRFWFFKVLDGQRGPLIGPEVQIPRGEWHELSVECKGNHIRCFLDGKELIPMITDNSFSSGKVGFWTKSDSVSYFADTRISDSSSETLAQTLVRSTLDEFPRLAGLTIFAVRAPATDSLIVASKEAKELGQAGGKDEADVIANGTTYYRRDKGFAYVTAPLRDRNGEPIAAVRVVLKSFPGQTQDNALSRATPIIRKMQARAQSLEELLR
jgi:hypothetical protein